MGDSFIQNWNKLKCPPAAEEHTMLYSCDEILYNMERNNLYTSVAVQFSHSELEDCLSGLRPEITIILEPQTIATS